MDVRPDRPPCPIPSLARGELQQVRLVADDLRREIRQLRLEHGELRASIRLESLARAEDAGAASDDAAPVARPAAVAPAFRPYAPPPIGRIIPRVETPLPPAPVVPIDNWYHVTNLGTLIDVLA